MPPPRRSGAAEPDLSSYALTYGELEDRSRRLATVLAGEGIGESSRVPVLLGKRPELVVALLALWRLGAVHVPLFTAFATGAIALRVEGSRAKHVITDASQREKVDPLDVQVLDIDDLVARAADAEPLADNVAIGGDGVFIQIYTSGTTGKPKGVPVPVRALASFHSYLHYALDVRQDDVFWNAADPGWAYGLFYALVTPMFAGRAALLVRAAFEPVQCLEVMRTFGVTNFCGAPTMYRAMRAAGVDASHRLRRASSAGEPLTLVPDGRHRAGDQDGYYFFNARDDDVILAAGYRIGPFDVESVLVTHPAVSEVAVVGRPDPDGVRGEMVEAFVVLMPGTEPGPALAEQLQKLVRGKYSKHAYPRRVSFVDELPKTPSGKVQRFLLRNQ